MQGVDRLDEMFAAGRAAGRALLLPYLTAGLPDPATSPGLFRAMAAAGADGFEVGIPYSDPLMDGPVIQEAGNRALAAGTDLAAAFAIVEEVAADTGKPVLVMTYVNPVLRTGPEEFARRAAAAGASGLIIADLPVEEVAPFHAAATAAGLGMALFVAPTTGEDRLRRIAASDPSFIYGVADLGVTGERAAASGRIEALAARIRAATPVPLVLGVGLSTPEQAAVAGRAADGVIVGSALVRRVLGAHSPGEAADALAAAVARFAAALRN